MESNNRKNKRGARGSIEEETNVAKRSNMADCEEVEELDASSSEPSLSDIKEMLVDIKTERFPHSPILHYACRIN